MAIFSVTTGADVVNASDSVTSLREALDSARLAPGADTIIFSSNVPTVTLNSVLTINDPGGVTVMGEAFGDVTIRQALTNPADGISGFIFNTANSVATLEGVRIAEGFAFLDPMFGGPAGQSAVGAIFNQGDLTLNRVLIDDNLAQGNDGPTGTPGAPGAPGASGAPGGNGGNGGPGGFGGVATIVFNEANATLRLSDTAFGASNGVFAGDGGSGGDGGNGGPGGIGPLGGRGGDGGDGGNGGAGGNGASTSTILNAGQVIGLTAIGDATFLDPTSGLRGPGGQGGLAGQPGSGFVSGAPGLPGNTGPFGTDGALGSLVNTNAGTGSLVDFETLVYVSGPGEIAEGAPFSFDVSRAGDPSDLTVSYTIQLGAGTTAADFAPNTPLAGSVSFSTNGPDVRTVTLQTFDDMISEGPETFTVALTTIGGPGGPTAGFGTSSTLGTIAANDGGSANGETGTPGDDRFVNTGRGDRFDGLGGRDTVVYTESFGTAEITINPDGSTTVKIGEITDTLVNIERIELSDGVLVFDLAGDDAAAEGIYRLYKASVGRTPDEEGLIFWTDRVDDGRQTLESMAGAFVDSSEFQSDFPPSLAQSNPLEFVERYYTNVLGRQADEAGRSFWSGKLNELGANAGTQQLLRAFAESQEFQNNNAEFYDDGVFVA